MAGVLRKHQTAHLLQTTATLTMGEPLLVCGDFNAPLIDSKLVTHVTEQGQAVDLDYVLQRFTTAWPVRNTEVVLQQASARLGICASDHFGVLVDLAS